MDSIYNRIRQERNHFHILSKTAQQLIKTFVLYELIAPLFGIFTTAFLWRKTQDINLIVIYYLLFYAAIPLGFYLNGILLRKFSVNKMSFIGMAAMGSITTIIMFLSSQSIMQISLFGFLNGIAVGIFWANRNLLTLKTTTSDTRIYFSGIESIISTSCKILVPFLIGWLIIFGSKTNLYNELAGYKLAAIAMLFIIFIYALVMNSFALPRISYKQLLLHNISPGWKKFQYLQVILGFLQAVLTILPVLMVLTFLGHEETLGTVQSIAAILSAFVVYKIAKSLGVKHRLLLLQISIVLGLIGAVTFSIVFSGIGVLVFYATQALSQPLWWIATSSLNYDLIDSDKNDQTHYAYISDQELYLNGGRIIALLVFISLVHLFTPMIALRYTPLIFTGAQILMIFLTKSIEKNR